MPVFAPNNYAQTTSSVLAVNTTTTSTTFVNLISIVVSTSGGSLNVFGSISSSNTGNGAENFFRITVDGTSIGASSSKGDLGTASGTIVAGNNIITNTGVLSAGSHTVVLQWRVSGGTGQIRPVAAVDQEYASLMLQEVNA